jgi:hypothetical protein
MQSGYRPTGGDWSQIPVGKVSEIDSAFVLTEQQIIDIHGKTIAQKVLEAVRHLSESISEGQDFRWLNLSQLFCSEIEWKRKCETVERIDFMSLGMETINSRNLNMPSGYCFPGNDYPPHRSFPIQIRALTVVSAEFEGKMIGGKTSIFGFH